MGLGVSGESESPQGSLTPTAGGSGTLKGRKATPSDKSQESFAGSIPRQTPTQGAFDLKKLKHPTRNADFTVEELSTKEKPRLTKREDESIRRFRQLIAENPDQEFDTKEDIAFLNHCVLLCCEGKAEPELIIALGKAGADLAPDPLFKAALEKGQMDIAFWLAVAGADAPKEAFKDFTDDQLDQFVNRFSEDQQIPQGLLDAALERKVVKGWYDDVKQLLKAGASPDLIDVALSHNQFRIARLLLSHGGATDSVTAEQRRTFMDYLLASDVNTLKKNKIPEEWLDVTFKEKVEAKQFVHLQKLLELGADPDQTVASGKSLLDDSIQASDFVTSLILLQFKADTKNVTSSQWQDLVAFAATKCNPASVYRQGVRFDQKTLDRLYVQELSAGNLNIASRLLYLGASIEAKSDKGEPFMHLAVQAKDSSAIKEALRRGASLHAAVASGKTPLNILKEQDVAYKEALLNLSTLLDARIKKLSTVYSGVLSDVVIRQTAYIIERVLPDIDKAAQSAMLHLNKYDLGTTHSMRYKTDGKGERELYVLLKSRGDLEAEGTSKKASQAFEIPLEETILTAKDLERAEAISKKGKGPKALKEIEEDFQILQELQDQRGIWKIRSIIKFTQTIEGKPVERVAGMLAKAKGNFAEMPLNIKEQIFYSRQLAAGLAYCHSIGLIHGDIKGLNALIGEGVAGLMDFGMRYEPEFDEVHPVLGDGTYGTLVYTAPELFGVKNFNGDWTKVDTFAFGVMLYEKHFNKSPPWLSILAKYKNSNEPVSEEDKQKLSKMIADTIDTPLTTMANSTPDERYINVIFRMLQSNPDARPSMEEVKAALDKIPL